MATFTVINGQVLVQMQCLFKVMNGPLEIQLLSEKNAPLFNMLLKLRYIAAVELGVLASRFLAGALY